jgi:polyphosphate kinase 2 (PPK2 family)
VCEQRARLLERIDRVEKSWKIEREDACDHHRHADYLRWYEECIRRTHTSAAPWFLVAADDKRSARLAAADIVLRQLEAIGPRYPKVSKKRARELKKLRSLLLNSSSAREQCHAD